MIVVHLHCDRSTNFWTAGFSYTDLFFYYQMRGRLYTLLTVRNSAHAVAWQELAIPFRVIPDRCRAGPALAVQGGNSCG